MPPNDAVTLEHGAPIGTSASHRRDDLTEQMGRYRAVSSRSAAAVLGSVTGWPRRDDAAPADARPTVECVTCAGDGGQDAVMDLVCVTVDCADPAMVAGFWSAALGWGSTAHVSRGVWRDVPLTVGRPRSRVRQGAGAQAGQESGAPWLFGWSA